MSSREPLPQLQELFERRRSTPSDINEHLDRLRELASHCEHVTEFGTRWATGSTVAFLAAQPAKFVAWDLDPSNVVSQNVLDLIAVAGRTKFEPRCGNTLEINIEPTEMLFIDTLHTFKQLRAELARHCDPIENKVSRYLVFHDTQTFGKVGEDGSTPGLRRAIRWFQSQHAFPLWELVDDRENNNGLVVLRHMNAEAR